MTQVKNSVLNQSISSLSNNIRNSSCSIASPISGAATPPASSAAGVGTVGMTLAAASLPGLLPPQAALAALLETQQKRTEAVAEKGRIKAVRAAEKAATKEAAAAAAAKKQKT